MGTKEWFGSVTDIKNFSYLCVKTKQTVLDVGRELKRDGREDEAFAMAIAATAMDTIIYMAMNGVWTENKQEG